MNSKGGNSKLISQIESLVILVSLIGFLNYILLAFFNDLIDYKILICFGITLKGICLFEKKIK